MSIFVFNPDAGSTLPFPGSSCQTLLKRVYKVLREKNQLKLVMLYSCTEFLLLLKVISNSNLMLTIKAVPISEEHLDTFMLLLVVFEDPEDVNILYFLTQSKYFLLISSSTFLDIVCILLNREWKIILSRIFNNDIIYR